MRTGIHEFTDAKEMASKYANFFRPDDDELNRLIVGDLVKLCLNGERFWIEIIEVYDDYLEGRVIHELLIQLNDHIQVNEMVLFNKDNIYDIH